LTDRILGTYKQKVQSLTLVPSGGGCFELTVDGKKRVFEAANG
jgi:predicted Rdx family selenoprotein